MANDLHSENGKFTNSMAEARRRVAREWQKQHMLEPTGELDAASKKMLADKCAKAEVPSDKLA